MTGMAKGKHQLTAGRLSSRHAIGLVGDNVYAAREGVLCGQILPGMVRSLGSVSKGTSRTIKAAFKKNRVAAGVLLDYKILTLEIYLEFVFVAVLRKYSRF